MTAAAKIEIAMPTPGETRHSPEFELLLACCAHPRDSDGTAQALGLPIDWEIALRLGEHHRVLPALHASLNGRDAVPGSISLAIDSRFQKNGLKALRFSAELARIARAFGDCGIDALAHKGPVLAQFLYGDPSMRQFGDLDFLVRPADVVLAKPVLRELGYESQLQLSPPQEQAYLRSGYEYVFALGSQRNLLELQWRIVPRFYSIEFHLEAAFGRAVEMEIEGFRVRTLGHEDLMLALCVHAAKHGWAQLGMLRDIAALADFGLDWNWIWAEARRLGIFRILLVSLLLARNLLSCPVPGNMPALGEIEDAEKLAEAIQLRLSTGEEADIRSLRYFRDFMNTRERWQDRTRFASRLALTPSLSEWESVRIPDSLFPLYRIVRMGRLLKRAIAMNGILPRNRAARPRSKCGC